MVTSHTEALQALRPDRAGLVQPRVKHRKQQHFRGFQKTKQRDHKCKGRERERREEKNKQINKQTNRVKQPVESLTCVEEAFSFKHTEHGEGD